MDRFKSSNKKAAGPARQTNGSIATDEGVHEFIDVLNIPVDEAGGYFQQVIRRFQDQEAK